MSLGEILSQIYLISAILGVGFITFNFITGQIGDAGDGGAGASALGAGGHDFGASDSGEHDFGAADMGGGHDLSSAQSEGPSGQLHQAMMATSAHSMALAPANMRSKAERTILCFLSPMGIAIGLAFFGLAGLLILANLPWIGWWSVGPALCFSFVVSSLFKACVRWMAKNMEVSTESRVDDLVGQVAEVNIPFKEGSTGEVIYVVGSKRYNAAARSYRRGASYARGSKVMILEVKQHMVLVEPYTDIVP
jgi:membrane protein implicated in regulation of membrane protease activity